MVTPRHGLPWTSCPRPLELALKKKLKKKNLELLFINIITLITKMAELLFTAILVDFLDQWKC